MRNVVMLAGMASIIVMGAGVAVTEPAPDSAIEDALVSSLLFIDDPASAREEFEYAKQLSGYDTNRLARLIAGLARTNDSWIAGGMIGRLGVYGSSENLPFLYSQVSNVEYGVRAVRSILRIEGVTSNSLAMVDDYLSMTNMAMPSREDICLELLRIRNRTNPGISLSNCVDTCALRFFASDDVYSEWYGSMKLKSNSGFGLIFLCSTSTFNFNFSPPARWWTMVAMVPNGVQFAGLN